MTFGGIAIETDDGPASAAVVEEDDVPTMVAAAMAAGADLIRVVYKGTNWDEAEASIACWRHFGAAAPELKTNHR